MINYYYDDKDEFKPYTYQTEATENTMPPDNATRIEPKFKDGYIPCFIDNSWVLKINNKGKTAYSTETKEQVTIDYYGDLKEGYTLLEPMLYAKWDNVKNAWIIDEKERLADIIRNNESTIESLIDLAETKIKTLNYAIELDITLNGDEDKLNAWKKYVVSLSRVDTNVEEMELPEKPF